MRNCGEKEVVTSIDVANFLIYLNNNLNTVLSNFAKKEKGETFENCYSRVELSPMKLQKMLFYAYAWYIAESNIDKVKKDEKINISSFEKLFNDEKPEAWMYGPVFPSIYKAFKGKLDCVSCTANGNKSIEKIKDTELEKFLINIFLSYKDFTAFDLSNMTHIEKCWGRTIQEKKNIIPDNYIFEDFSKKLLEL